jgi:hypothetical protein
MTEAFAIDNSNVGGRNWRTLLKQKRLATQKNYVRHIKEFQVYMRELFHDADKNDTKIFYPD